MISDFLRRNAAVMVGLVALSIVVSGVLIFLYEEARLRQELLLQRVDAVQVNGKLPGPKDELSDRSKKELNVIFSETPHIVGGIVSRLTYGKTDDPLIYVWSGSDPSIIQFTQTFHDLQVNGKGMSSAEAASSSKLSLRNSDEARQGLIKCGPLDATNLAKITPSIAKVAKGACRATLPPFDPNVNLAIVVAVDVDGDAQDERLEVVRRALLQLQIDIFNRDYMGRETWPHQ